MAWLLDTNVVSTLYKKDAATQRVRTWLDNQESSEIFLSVLVMGEIRRGVELLRLKDLVAARSLDKWLQGLEVAYGNRILPVTAPICDLWGRLSPHQPLPQIDGLLAATALFHRLTLVTRNTADIARSGVDYFNPFVE